MPVFIDPEAPFELGKICERVLNKFSFVSLSGWSFKIPIKWRKSESLKVLETGSVIGGVKASKFEVFGFIEGEIYADDIVIGKTATIKGDIFFKENLKIDEGADVDGYIKRVNQGKQTSSKPQQSQKAKVKEEKKEKQLEIEDTEKKAVNQS